MKTQKSKKPKEIKASGAEKPVSLWSASFTEVLGALLKTKPIQKEKESKKKGE